MAEHDNWDEHWTRYADAAGRNPAQQMRHGIIVKLLQHGATADARVLDLGSGQGDMLVRLRRVLPQAELLGFELSASGVEISKRKLPGAKFVVADLFSPPAELEGFRDWATAAVCSEVLEHVDSPVDFLKATRPYLRDGARLVVTVPGGPMSAFDRHIGHRQHFTRDSITRALQAADFTVDRVCLSGFPFFNLYRGIVIARGEKLVADGASQNKFSARLAAGLLAVFNGLFRFNLMNSPFGWQVVVAARKSGSD